MFKGYESDFQQQFRRTPQTATTASSPFLLTLPRIDPSVPVCYSQVAHPSIALLASQLGRVDVIREEDISNDDTIDGVIETTVKRELEAAVGDLRILDLAVYISDGEVDSYAEIDEEHNAKSQNGRFHFTVDCQNIPTVFVGPRIAALEEIRTGLGETIYAVLQWAGYGSMNLFTFNYVFEVIPWLYHLDEREDDPEADSDEDDDFSGLPSKSELLADVPLWASTPKLKLTPRQLKAISRQPATPLWVKELIVATLEAAEAWKAGANKLGRFSYGEFQPVYTLAYVRFNREDTLGMVMDDYINMANSCSDSYSQNSHFELVYHSEQEDFREWWNGILAGFRLVRSIDNLLLLLSDEKLQHESV